jgi:hypothetical protein
LKSDAHSFAANRYLKKVDVVVSLIITKDLDGKAYKLPESMTDPSFPAVLSGGGMQKIECPEAHGHGCLYGHHELSDTSSQNPDGSYGLFQYYKELDMTILRCPMNDFTTPTAKAFVDCVERISVYLAQGRNVVVHCFGGSGRTGTIVLGVAKALGVPDIIAESRKPPGKSAYLDVHEQEVFIDQQPMIATPYMLSHMTDAQREAIWGGEGRMEKNQEKAEKGEMTKGRKRGIAQCLDKMGGVTGQKIVMQRRCDMFARCRGCMGDGDGTPGSYPPATQVGPDVLTEGPAHMHMPQGDERYPAELTFGGILWYNYWLNDNVYFQPFVQDEDPDFAKADEDPACCEE